MQLGISDEPGTWFIWLLRALVSAPWLSCLPAWEMVCQLRKPSWTLSLLHQAHGRGQGQHGWLRCLAWPRLPHVLRAGGGLSPLCSLTPVTRPSWSVCGLISCWLPVFHLMVRRSSVAW